MTVAKESKRKSKKSCKAAAKRRGKASPSLTIGIGQTSRAAESAVAAATSMVASLLNSFVRDVISAGLTATASMLVATKEWQDEDKGGDSAHPVTRARSVKSVAPGSRRKPDASSGGALTEEPALAKASRKGAAKASSAPTKKKRSDAGVKRVQWRKSGSADGPATPSTLAEANTVVPAAVLSAAKPKERAAPKARRKKSAPSPVARTRRKRSDAGVKRVSAQQNGRAKRLVEPAALKEPNTSTAVSAPSGAQPKRSAAPKAAPKNPALSTGARTRKKRSGAGVKGVPAGRKKRTQGSRKVAAVKSGTSDPESLPSDQPDASTPDTAVQVPSAAGSAITEPSAFASISPDSALSAPSAESSSEVAAEAQPS